MQRFYAFFTFLALWSVQLSAQSANCLNIYLAQADASGSDTLVLDVRVRDFNGVVGLQYTSKWDTAVLDFIGVSNFGLPELRSSNFSLGSPNLNKGLLSLSWFKLDSTYRQDGARLYSLKFFIKNKVATATSIQFADEPVPSEVTYNGTRALSIPGLIGLKVNLKSTNSSDPLHITRICSAMSTCLDSLASAFVEASGGTAPYRYLWLGKTQNFQERAITGAKPGPYLLWVIDAKQDTALALVGVSKASQPGFGIYVNISIACDDTSKQKATITAANLALPGTFSFAWSNGQRDENVAVSSIRVSKDSIYSLTVTDASGCKVTLPNLSAAICYNDTNPVDTIPQDTIMYPGANLSVENTIAKSGEVFCADVVASNIPSLSGLQFALRWDTSMLTFHSVKYPKPEVIDPNTLGLNKAAKGELRFVKVYSPFAAAFAYEKLFEVCFSSKSSGDSTQIVFAPDILPTLAIDAQQNIIPLNTYAGSALVFPAIWPGDADRNGTVDQFDLLPIGLAYGTSGTTRSNPQITWEAQSTQKWGKTLVNSNIDLAFVDADGNGLIDAADTSAMARNWQRKHNDGLPKLNQPEIRTGGASLFINADTVLSGPGQWFPLELGTPDQAAENVYGLAFSVVYNPNEVKENELKFSPETSWLGTLGQDLLAFQRHNPTAGRIDVALVRSDGRNVSGSGRIGKVKITIEDVILNLRDGENPKIQLGIENVRLINNADHLVPITPLSSTPSAKKQVSTSAYNPYLDARIRVYPQPATDLLYLDYGDLQLRSVQLLQLDGKALSGILAPQRSLSLAGVPAGVYLLKVVAESGVAMKKVLVTR
ncbi:T9SS type A sorting domain-containing protein [Haliscomenobacter hydrossis]|uniref:Secretion system C-terminal sorting domain-containing protein n=1 Tax=Haliscomenobacter hydrossis (strain ATCC 27775 / DSM 1100 / LMG 10767 / O) TaxID=760192 RepID=F4KT87_HALH1|nr:T9SS type A sorting domain-containing protein [Haliscomenobacter hydrossis]AEE51144.1 hypothetical protein Halhy_3285 [Haliscomenobacter hydrossis DSM 1100]